MSDMDLLFDLVRETQNKELAVSTLQRHVRQRLLAPSRPKQHRRWMIGVTGGLVAAAAAAVLFVSVKTPSEQELVAESGAWFDSNTEPLPIEFADGSSVVLSPASSLTLPRISGHGADVELRHGSARFSVEHFDDTDWTIHAGPYDVHVIGTVFEVDWDAESQHFEVRVEEGEVEVDGPNASALRLRSGQVVSLSRLVDSTDSSDGAPDFLSTESAEPEENEIVTPPSTEAPDFLSTESAEPEGNGNSIDETVRVDFDNLVQQGREAGSVAEFDRQETQQERRRALGSSRGSDWRQLGRNGNYQEALEVLDQQGFSRTVSNLNAQEFLILAQWAQRARDERSSSLLEQVRERFAGTPQAADAAFLLSRITNNQAALRWNQIYEDEAPNGRFARENAGRILELLGTREHNASVARRARDYLRRFPDGPHGDLARRLSETSNVD